MQSAALPQLIIKFAVEAMEANFKQDKSTEEFGIF